MDVERRRNATHSPSPKLRFPFVMAYREAKALNPNFLQIYKETPLFTDLIISLSQVEAMFPGVLLCAHGVDFSRRKKRDAKLTKLELDMDDLYSPFSIPFFRDPSEKPAGVSLHSDHPDRDGVFKVKKKAQMDIRPSNFTNLIQRVTTACLRRPLADGRYDSDGYVEAEEESIGGGRGDWKRREEWERRERVVDMENLISQVFEAVMALKNSYVNLQEAHYPWEPEKMRVADVAVVAELRRLGLLREKFRRNGKGRMVREVVAPYEKAVAELTEEVKARETEVENLKEKLRTMAALAGNAKNFKLQSKRKVSCNFGQVSSSPAPELFDATMSQVKQASKSFTSLLLSLMRSAHWDIAAAVRSIEAAAATLDTTFTDTLPTGTTVAGHHAKFALESYISRKLFQGFDHETFYMDGTLSAVVNADQFRRDCFAQYRDMTAMDPAELLGILPTCHFGKFCSKKYLSIVHPKMEESLFGDSEQNRQVMAGKHPRSQFYDQFLKLAKAIWLLHLLAFSLEPPPSLFEASRGAEFHQQYMKSVVKFSGGWVPGGKIVGFPVSPGFKLGNGLVIKARVFLVSSR